MRSFIGIHTIFTEYYPVDLYQKEGHVGGRTENRNESGVLDCTQIMFYL